jgi:hypothetical protein
MKSNLTKLAAAGALTLVATAAFAGSMTQPGITIGGSDAPLPPGLYFIDTIDWGVRDGNTPANAGTKTAVGVHAPVLAWSTPWQILGARLSFAVAVPSIEVGVTGLGNGTYAEGMFNPFFGATLSWNLGNGFNFAYTAGAYPRVNTSVGADTNTFEQRAGLTYLANGWNLRANLIYGINDTPVGATNSVTNPNPDYVNLDVHAIKSFGKWEVGAVGFGAWDVSDPFPGYQRHGEVALGALLGYNWGPVITQAYVTRDVWEQNVGGFDTRVWARIVVPLGDPLASLSAAPMYHK